MKSFGSHDARIHLTRLLDEVERGELITITRRGKPIARLVPAQSEREDVEGAIEAMLAYRDRHGPVLGDGRTVRDMIAGGRP